MQFKTKQRYAITSTAQQFNILFGCIKHSRCPEHYDLNNTTCIWIFNYMKMKHTVGLGLLAMLDCAGLDWTILNFYWANFKVVQSNAVQCSPASEQTLQTSDLDFQQKEWLTKEGICCPAPALVHHGHALSPSPKKWLYFHSRWQENAFLLLMEQEN